MQKRIICENLRSAYNVWNIIRTADGLGWWVVLVWYTAPKEHKKVSKTALGAEESVPMKTCKDVYEFYNWVKSEGLCLISAEKTDASISLGILEWHHFAKQWVHWEFFSGVAVVMGNEVTWVEASTQEVSDYVVHIPMVWAKESFNVGQAAAIFMRELNKILKSEYE